GRIDLVDAEDVRGLGPGLHERLRRIQPGVVSRDEAWWKLSTGQVRVHPDFHEPFHAAYRSASGEVEGMVAYTADDRWGGSKQPLNTVQVKWLTGVTPAAQRALWRYLCAVDWVVRVESDWRAPDDLLPYYLPDPRAAAVTGQADWLWGRILDVVRALEMRT